MMELVASSTARSQALRSSRRFPGHACAVRYAQALAEHFVAMAAHRYGRSASLSAGACAYLTAHAWPGNLRELRDACERAVLLATSTIIERDDLDHIDAPAPSNIRRESTHTPEPLRDTLAAIERERILEALDGCGGNQTRAAAMLGISRRTLGKRLDEYGLARPRKPRS